MAPMDNRSSLCVYEIRNESRRESFLVVTGPASRGDWTPEHVQDFLPKWSAEDRVTRRVVEDGLSWAEAEVALLEACGERYYAGWTVMAPLFPPAGGASPP